MSISTMKNAVVRSMHRGILVAQKNSPTVLTAVGIVGTIVTTVMASKATLKVEPIIDDAEGYLAIAKDQLALGDINRAQYTREVGTVYARTSLDLVKLYGPSVSVGVLSVACIVGAHGMMHKRNAALAAAYTTLERGFSEYRKRVEDSVGPERERELRYGLKDVNVKDKETGEVVAVSKIVDPNGLSIYARFFDELNENWQPQGEYNLTFLRQQQNYYNDRLHAHGHVFLNEVYDALGLPRSPAGQVVGWLRNENGDNFVDFGLYDGSREIVREFVNGHEKAILLDFNVDGVIYDQI